MKKRNWARTGIAALACALVGAGAGIASGTASTKHHSTSRQDSTTTGQARPPRPFGRGHGPGGFRGGFGPVHSEAVVLNKAGTGYVTVTDDNGTVKSVSGNDVTITEGTTKVPYKDVTVTIPSGATIVRNFAKAGVGDLAAGDRISVSSSSDGTFVFAVDASHQPNGRGGPGGPGHGWGGHPGGPPHGTTGSTGSTGTQGTNRGGNQPPAGPPPAGY